jgi:secondary thiamine-phosphate synthase enzyme
LLQILETISVKTKNQNLYEITDNVLSVLHASPINNGLLNLSILHTSASLIIQENVSSEVKDDLNIFFNKLVPMVNGFYKHDLEGIDDMPAHIKTTLTNTNLTISVKNKNLVLGTWQGIFLFEHRISPQKRKIFFHLLGE